MRAAATKRSPLPEELCRAGASRMRQNAREVMMQGATLIVRIGGAVVVMAATRVDMVVMGVTANAGVAERLPPCPARLRSHAGDGHRPTASFPRPGLRYTAPTATDQ